MTLVVVLALAAVAVAVATAVAVRADRDAESDRHWHWHGFFYANPNDRTVFVPKRHGLGWTLNFGRPVSWVLLIALIAVPAVVAAAGH